jgi:hypothetical protein
LGNCPAALREAKRELAEGIKNVYATALLTSLKIPRLSSNVQIAFVFPETLSAICLISIAENERIFSQRIAEKRHDTLQLAIHQTSEIFLKILPNI